MMEERSVIQTSLHDVWSGGSSLLEEEQQQNLHTLSPPYFKTKKMNLKVSFLLT